MNDLLPADAGRWRAMEQAFHTACERAGFGEVRTPLCEYTELFVRGVGETTDVVEKEMYSFDDRGGRSLTLRPEGTAGAVRAYLESVAGSEPLARWYYLGPMFRGERPAKGRYRQFHQLGVEVYGDGSAAVDAEVIHLGATFLHDLGIANVDVRINSLGSGDARARHREALVRYFTPLRERLSVDSQRRLGTNPLRIIDSKAPEDIALRVDAPSMSEFLSDADRRHFDAVQAILTRLGVSFVVDPTIVRGLDYYTRTIFEFKDNSGALGAQNALGGGGRYDLLIEQLGGRPTPAVGFGLGCERLLLASQGHTIAAHAPSAMVIGLAKETETDVQAEALALATELRAAGVVVHVDTRFGKADRQFRVAERHGARVGLIVGSAELASGTVNVKDLAARTQRAVARASVVNVVRTLLAQPLGQGAA